MQPETLTGFLESELGKTHADDCLFHVIPAGYEKSVSYGTGTDQGPSAIIHASQYLELFDGESVPAEKGIHTLPPVDCDGHVEDVLGRIEMAVGSSIASGKIPVILGGEHTVSVGAFNALKKLNKPIGIIQFDAHADLRDTFEDSIYSHACALHHAVEFGFSLLQIGVRSLSPFDISYRKEKSVLHLDADSLFNSGIPTPLLPPDFPETIYITFDVDGLDPSVIPATGTPEPGGLLWYQAMTLLKSAIDGRRVIGFDVVELAPMPYHHASDFTAARLVYNIMGMIVRNIG
jgi:agmatinase